MKTKGDAHEGLSLMAQRDGVPPTLIMDGSKEQTLGLFRKKARLMGCRIKQTEPYSPWQNAAEGTIRELKKATARKMTQQHSPLKLWDHCLELTAYQRSNTSNDNFELEGEVPETILSGQTADISPFIELEWFEFVKFIPPGASFPDPGEELGRWLGPAIDIGPVMTSKIIKKNGQVLHLSTYRPLSDDKI